MMWWAVGGSLFASNMGSEHFIGLAGSGAATGIGVVAYEWHASWILLLLGFFFVPIYIRSKIFTMPEYLEKRFRSRWMRFYLTIISLISYITTKIAVDLYAGGLFLKKAIGLNIYVSSAIILSFTAIYTLLGGLTAVIYTDVMQCTIMVVGAVTLSAIGFKEIGGYSALWEKYPLSVGNATVMNATVNASLVAATTIAPTTMEVLLNSTNGTGVSSCYQVESHWDHMFRPLSDSEFPWIGIVFSLPVTGIWYWCTDQVIVQRTLGAKNINHARLGTVLAGFLKLLPLYIMVMPGMISRIRNPDLIGCPDPESCLAACGNKYGCSNEAYPDLVLNILPVGLVGLLLAVMIAALMSSLSSAFNSSSTIFTMDIWTVLRPKASQREQVIVGRLVVVFLVVIGIAWIPIVSQGHGGQLFKYLQTIQSYLAPPTCAVFLVGMLWPRLHERGALTSMLIGLVLGIARLAFDVVWPQPHCGEVDNRNFFVRLHFMYYALIMFFLCIIIMVSISLLCAGKPIPEEQLGALTWKTLKQPRYNHPRSTDRGGEYIMSSKNEEFTMLSHLPHESRENLTDPSLADELREINEFENQPAPWKWTVRMAAVFLVVCLIAQWVVYR